MNAPVEPAGTRSDRGLRAAVILCATVIVLTALYFTGSIFAPLAFAMLIIAVMWPLQERLQARLPKLVALFLTMLATVVILAAFVSLIAWGFGRVGRFVVADAPRFQFLYGQVAEWLEGHGIVLAGLWAEHFNVGRLIGLFQQLTVRLNGMLSFSLVMLIYVMLASSKSTNSPTGCVRLRLANSAGSCSRAAPRRRRSSANTCGCAR
jgi:AI-2 transport protein TqsA